MFTLTKIKMKIRVHYEESLKTRLSNLIKAGHGSIVGDYIKFVRDSLIILNLNS